ncbi:MAG: transglutaminase domain-containing protein, partial [Coprococcus sp.]
MRDLWKHGIALVLALSIICLQCEGVRAEETELSDQGSIEVIYVNPLYADVIQESDLVRTKDTAEISFYAEQEYTDSVQEAAAQIRRGMKQREETIVVYYQSALDSKDDIAPLAKELAAEALVHTGNPEEGDYLKWQYGGWTADINFNQENGIYYMTFTYTYTYYTTIEQEEAVDEKMNEVLTQLDVEGKRDYVKVRAVYDYICEHVTYDNDNKNNKDYKLQYTAYGALIDEKAVCQGYAVLFYRMALELGIDSRLIAGTGNGESHGWNIVELEGLYYNGDTTWDAGEEEYDYFLKCEANFKGHERNEEYTTDDFNKAYPMAAEDYVDAGEEPDQELIGAPSITSVYSRVQESVKITWTPVEGADGYQLFRAASQDPAVEDWVCVKTIAGDNVNKYMNEGCLQYVNVNLEIGQTYYYKVRAFRMEEGVNDISDEASRIYSEFSEVKYMPAAVVFDNVYSNSDSRVRLIWNEVDGAHGYQLWRLDADGSYKVVKTFGDKGNTLTDNQGTVTAYSNTGLEAGETYIYKIRAFSIPEDGTKVFGAYSDEIKVAVAPEAPVLSVSSDKSGRASLKWNTVNGAAGYQ